MIASLRQPNKQDWAALLAEHIGCEVKAINRIVNGRSSIGAELAMRLAGALGTSSEFWLNVPGGSPTAGADIAPRRQPGEPSCIARNARCASA